MIRKQARRTAITEVAGSTGSSRGDCPAGSVVLISVAPVWRVFMALEDRRHEFMADDLERLVGLIRIKNKGRRSDRGTRSGCPRHQVTSASSSRLQSSPFSDAFRITSWPRWCLHRQAPGRKTVNIKTYSRHGRPGYQPPSLRLLPRPYRPGRAGPGAAMGHRLGLPVRAGAAAGERRRYARSRSGSPPASGKPTGKRHGSSRRSRHRRCSSPIQLAQLALFSSQITRIH